MPETAAPETTMVKGPASYFPSIERTHVRAEG